MTDSPPPGTREQLLALILGHAMRREPFRLGVDWPDGPGVRAAYDEALEVARGVLGWPGFRPEAPYADADRDSDPGAPPPIAPISPAETETGHDTDEARMSAELHVAGHPLIQHKLGLMRETSCASNDFRRLLGEIAMLLCYEVTRDLPLEDAPIETPLEPMMAPRLAGRKLVLAPVLRAGLGMLDGMLSLIPSARVAHVGLFRDPATLQAVEYYFKAPSDVAERLVLVLDPMLATAHSAVAAVDRFKARGCKDLRFVCLLAAPEGIKHFHEHHPDVPVWTASVDRALDDHGYIRPGLGDAGDRMWGTK